jgi:toxin-antitoxin system PIN domain toxin
MKLPDVNVLLYAVNTAAPQHAVAKQALQDAFTEGDVGLPWAVLLGFLRLTTRSGILSQPLTVDDALQIVHSWLDHPAATSLAPGDRHAAILSRLLVGAGQGGSLVSDAHLAALAIEHNAELLSFDRDFARFAGLRWTALA